MDIAPVQRSIVALKRHEWFRVYGRVMSEAASITRSLSFIALVLSISPATASSTQLEHCIIKIANVFDLTLEALNPRASDLGYDYARQMESQAHRHRKQAASAKPCHAIWRLTRLGYVAIIVWR